MSLLLLLLPVALAGLPPHHQQLVERFGAENVNFDKNVSFVQMYTERNYNAERRGYEITEKLRLRMKKLLIRCQPFSVTRAWK